MPDWIFSSCAYQMACLRGLMDTDGSVYQHRYRVSATEYAYPKLAFSNAIPGLREFVVATLQLAGIKSYHNPRARQVFVSSKSGVVQYFELIGTHNPRYWQRFQQFWRGARGAESSSLLMS